MISTIKREKEMEMESGSLQSLKEVLALIYMQHIAQLTSVLEPCLAGEWAPCSVVLVYGVLNAHLS